MVKPRKKNSILPYFTIKCLIEFWSLRFEHVLQIYWTKGFFFGGKLFYFNKTFSDVFENTPGLGIYFKDLMLDRFELKNHVSNRCMFISDIESKYHVNIIDSLNLTFSQISSVNNSVEELKKFNILRLYLIKSHRGKCHALGKPVRGQRTWSNAWNSYKVNKVLRSFINETKKKIMKNKKEEKINYKLLSKKYVTKSKKKKTIKVKKLLWF